MMRLKVQRVFEATQVLANIINENRPLPTKGRFRVSRMHAELFPAFTTANDQRSAKIASYDHRNGDGAVAVPDDKMPEFVAWWRDLAAEEVEANVEPLPVELLGDDSVSFADFQALGELVADQ